MEEALLQKYGSDPKDPYFPWRVIVIGMIMQRSNRGRAAPIIDEMLQRWPQPEQMMNAPGEELVALLMPLGMALRRSAWVRQISKHYAEWLQDDHVPDLGTPGPPTGLIGFWPGIGPYALEQYQRFVKGIDVTA